MSTTMKPSKRTDIHRPSALIPSDYVEVIFFEGKSASDSPFTPRDPNIQVALAMYLEHGAKIHGGMFTCDVCGAHYIRGSLFKHVATGEIISMGHNCADKLEFLRDSNGAESLQRRQKEANLRAIERHENWLNLAAWARLNREYLPALKCKHRIVQDIRAKIVRFGSATEKQLDLVRKLHADSLQPAELHVPIPVTGKRTLIEGLVVGTKWQDSDFGGALKIIVKVETPDGSWLVFGTAPSSLIGDVDQIAFDAWEAFWKAHRAPLDGETPEAYRDRLDALVIPERTGTLKGKRVSFTAKIEAGREPHFGFFSRPTKAKLLGGEGTVAS